MGGHFWTGFLAGTVSVATLMYLFNNWKLQEEEEKRKKKQEQESNLAEEGEEEEATTSRSLFLPFSKALNSPRPAVSVSNFFLSDIVKELWSHIDTVLSESIRESIEPMFATMLPAPLSTLRFTKFSLGSNPIKLENVVVHEADRQTGVVKFNMDVDWEADCDIQLKADYLGTVGIESLTFRGKLEFLLHPMDKIPIVSAVEYSLVNMPEIDFDFSGLAAVADLKIVKTRMLPIIEDSLASMLVLPQRMLYLMDAGVKFVDVHTPLRGVARITLHRGKGFKVENLMFGRKDVPDVYCIISLGNKKWKSKTIEDSVEPVWNESSDFCLSDTEQMLVIHAYDSDDGTLDADDYLGFGQVTVAQLLSAVPGVGLQVQLTNPQDHSHSKQTGASVTVSVELLSFTEDLSSLKTISPNTISGLIEIIVLRGLNLPTAKEAASSFVKVTCGTHEFFTGTVVDYPGIDALNPIYDCYFLVPIEVKDDDNDIVLTLCNNLTDVLGTYNISSEALKKMPHGTLSGRQPIGDQGASLELCVSIRGTLGTFSRPPASATAAAGSSSEKSTNLRGAATAASATTATPTGSTPTKSVLPAVSLPFMQAKPKAETRPQIGTVRITAVKGWGFKPIKRLLRQLDVPDVYLSISIGSSSGMKWRTATIWNNCNPEWNESKEFPLYDEADAVNVKVYDDCEAKEKEKGESIGTGSIILSKLLANPARAMDLTIKRKAKGTVGFIALRAERIS